jgi:SAM-dependent methyltransferase
MGESVDLNIFYQKHDAEILDKLNYTGTEIYRDKVYMDVGCGGGGLADFIRGVAQKVVLIEPTNGFAIKLREKDYEVYPDAKNALEYYSGKIQLLTSYDVIEHVEDPQIFLNDIYDLLEPGGVAFIGTPTEYPVLRKLLYERAFDSFVFSVQHLWVFSGKNLKLMARKCGFSNYDIQYFQRFGIGNLISWLQTGEPHGEVAYEFVTKSLDSVYKSEMAREETAEYLVLRLEK